MTTPLLAARAAVFDRLLGIWNGGDPDTVHELITHDYLGHMLHLESGERTGFEYPGWIHAYREANPATRFRVVDQGATGDRLWTRLVATRAAGGAANGMNVSRFVGDRIAEEWAVWSPWSPT